MLELGFVLVLVLVLVLALVLALALVLVQGELACCHSSPQSSP